MSMGLNAANAIYACLWCTIHRDKRLVLQYKLAFNPNSLHDIHCVRCDTSISLEECEKDQRTLADIKKKCTKSTVDARLGCIHPPLFEIELDHVVIDELHLLLRVTDKLISALILRMAHLDHSSRIHQGTQSSHMRQLVSAIKSCGVSFQVRHMIMVVYFM